MSSLPSPDQIADRRALRRKLTWWRAIAFGVAALAIVGVGLLAAGRGGPPGGEHVAKVAITGVITGDEATLKLLRDVGASRSARAALLMIDSPGGTTAGSERLYDEIRRLSEKKPVVAVVGTMAASGGYIAAIGADQIVAEGNSLVGSIGVLFQYPNVVKLLETVGVKVDTVKSSPLKAAPSPFEPTDEAARAAIAALVADSYAWFKDLVKTRRGLDQAALDKVADGRVFTGRQGVELKLVDRIGGERAARDWLAAEKNIPVKTPAREWKRDRDLRFGLFSMTAWALEGFGFQQLAATLRRADADDALKLDGLLAIWQGH